MISIVHFLAPFENSPNVESCVHICVSVTEGLLISVVEEVFVLLMAC